MEWKGCIDRERERRTKTREERNDKIQRRLSCYYYGLLFVYGFFLFVVVLLACRQHSIAASNSSSYSYSREGHNPRSITTITNPH
jgi:hypothetical protein